jgi:zinc protease
MSRRAAAALFAALGSASLLANQAVERAKPAAPAAAAPAAAAPTTPAPDPAAKRPQGARPAAARPTFDRDRYRIPHKKFVLENGLTLIVHEDHSVPIVAVNLWYHVGSRNEQRGKTGFAHLFEHFFFNGSENYPHGFREAMDDLGANNRNGTTSTDRTNFFEDVPVSALERTLYLEADRMGFLAKRISKEMLERERGVVQNEKRQGENQPYGRVFSQVVETIYPSSHPYSWSTIGSMADLNAATLDDVKEWYAGYYGPNNCVLSLAGDITPERALELVKKYFNGIPPGPPLRRAAQWVPRFERHLRDEMEDRVPQTRIYRFYHVPGWRDADVQYLNLAASVLSGSKSARLDRRLVYEKELATDVSAFVWDKELASNVILVMTLKAGVEPAAAERELDAVLATLLAEGPTAAELQRAQSRRLADFVRGTERLGGFGGRSDVLAQSATYAGDPEAYLAQLEALATAGPAAVKAAANRWLDAPHYTMVVKPFPRLAPGQTTLDRKVLPALASAPDVDFPKVQRATLSNGLSVILLQRHATPLVNLALAVDAGYAADVPAKAGLASLALGLMDEGTLTRDQFRIVDELDALGARLTTSSSLDLSFVRLQALAANLQPSLQIMADVVLNPAFPADRVAHEKRQRLAEIGQEKQQPVAAALRVLPRLLYGPAHAYSLPFTGSGFEDTVEGVTRDDLAAWHRAWFHPNHSTIIAAGDVTMARLTPALEKAFSAWKRGESPGKRLASVPRSKGGQVYLIDRPDAQQSVIVAAHVTEPGGQPEDLSIQTVMRNFGGIATSRLNRNLRLDKHWSYGTGAVMQGARGQRPFYVFAPVQTDKTKESMIEVEKELRGVAGERPLAGEEFASIMRNQTLSLPGRFETLESLVGAATDLVRFGYPDDYFANYARNVRALDEAALNGAAKKFIRPAEIIWIVIGDLRKVEAGVRELGYGEVVRLDADGKTTN